MPTPDAVDDIPGDVVWRTAAASTSLYGEVHLPGVPMTYIAELSKALDVRHALNFTSHAHFQKIEVKLPQFMMLVPRQLGKH